MPGTPCRSLILRGLLLLLLSLILVSKTHSFPSNPDLHRFRLQRTLQNTSEPSDEPIFIEPSSSTSSPPEAEPSSTQPPSTPTTPSSVPFTAPAPQTEPVEPSPTVVPLEPIAPSSTPTSPLPPTSAPQVVLPPYLTIPDHASTCIGSSPGPVFKCLQGIWVSDRSVVVGRGEEISELVISGPTFIDGDLTIVDDARWRWEVPLENPSWQPDLRTHAMLTVRCISARHPPTVNLSSNGLDVLFGGKKTSPYTVSGLVSRCDSTTTAAAWNALYNDEIPVKVAGNCRKVIVQHRTFPSELELNKYEMRLRFQWKSDCGYSSPTGMIVGIFVGFVCGAGLLFVLGVYCQCSGKGGGGEGGGTSADSNHTSTGCDTGGGGGGGGDGGFTSSSAGNWD